MNTVFVVVYEPQIIHQVVPSPAVGSWLLWLVGVLTMVSFCLASASLLVSVGLWTPLLATWVALWPTLAGLGIAIGIGVVEVLKDGR